MSCCLICQACHDNTVKTYLKESTRLESENNGLLFAMECILDHLNGMDLKAAISMAEHVLKQRKWEMNNGE